MSAIAYDADSGRMYRLRPRRFPLNARDKTATTLRWARRVPAAGAEYHVNPEFHAEFRDRPSEVVLNDILAEFSSW